MILILFHRITRRRVSSYEGGIPVVPNSTTGGDGWKRAQFRADVIFIFKRGSHMPHRVILVVVVSPTSRVVISRPLLSDAHDDSQARQSVYVVRLFRRKIARVRRPRNHRLRRFRSQILRSHDCNPARCRVSICEIIDSSQPRQRVCARRIIPRLAVDGFRGNDARHKKSHEIAIGVFSHADSTRPEDARARALVKNTTAKRYVYGASYTSKREENEEKRDCLSHLVSRDEARGSVRRGRVVTRSPAYFTRALHTHVKCSPERSALY